MVRISCVAAAAFLILSSPAFAQTKNALTSAEIETVLSDAGMAVTMMEDAASGAPVASAQAGQVQFWVRAIDCKGAPKACSTLVFFANFELGRAATQADYEIVNRFNDSQVFGRAYLLPARNEVGVDYVIELDGGVAPGHISANVARWADVIAAFISHFSSGPATS
jgi:hypothetical protein